MKTSILFIFLSLNLAWGAKDPQVIGGAFNSKENFFLPGVKCVVFDSEKDVLRVFNNESIVNYNENSSSLTIDRQFGFGFDFTLIPPTQDEFGISLDWMETLSESDIDALASYKTTVFIGSEILALPLKLTEDALKLSVENPRAFDDLCGDSFVTRVDKGAVGEVSVKIKINDYTEKNEIMSEMAMSFLDIGDFSANISKLKEKKDLKFKIMISGKQEGGFTANINSIFGGAVADCSADSLEDCKEILADVTDYFSGPFVSQFEPYYRDDNGSGVIPLPVTAAPLSYVTTSYCMLGVHSPPHLSCDNKVDNEDSFVDFMGFIDVINQSMAAYEQILFYLQ